MEKLTRENFSNICRTCLIENDHLKSLFGVENTSEMLVACTSTIVTKGDGLPENICLKCFQKVIDTFSFKELCKKSDSFLRNIMKTSTTFNSKQKLPYVETNDTAKDRFISVGCTDIVKNELSSKYDDVYSDISETEKHNTSLNIRGELNHDQVDSYTKYGKHIACQDELKEKIFCENTDKSLLNPLLTFNCKECEKVFASKRSHKRHTSKCRNNIKSKKIEKCFDLNGTNKLPVTCDICNKTFRFHSMLGRHKLTHTGEKPYLCNICGKGFNQMSYLKFHVFTHTGEKPYKCLTCDKSFAAPGTLVTHIRTHTGERPHICKICGKGFPQSGYLSVHIRTHTGEKPIECSVCHRRFTQSGRLAIHMRIHSGEKPYSCTHCDRSFSIKGTLKKHMRTHTGERPFVCKVCGLAFSQSGTLRIHMKLHLKKES